LGFEFCAAEFWVRIAVNLQKPKMV